ncbi:MAG TPA: lamin tail domain-containing protein [Methylomirabilota bacterium]|nr:lamin tail domain-containing protein [Methylomirabilota bacterium]
MLPTRAAEPFISEFMADNARIITDEDGQFPDWVEIQNPNASPLNLAGYFLTDDAGQLAKWAFPSVALPPNGLLVVFASGKDRTADTNRLHTSFQLKAAGGYLALVKPDGSTIVSAFNYPDLKEDVSFGIAQKQITTLLLANSAPRILVPINAAGLPANWNQSGYTPDGVWTNGVAPPAVGFDTNQVGGAPVNVAPSGTAVQSSGYNGNTYPATLAIDNNLGNFTHTAVTDNAAFWQVTLTNEMAIYDIVLFNRGGGCCQWRLRDITIEIVSTNAGGSLTNWISPLLNPENSLGGPAYLSNNLVTITGGPVLGRTIRVHRKSDPDNSGAGTGTTTDDQNVLSLGEVRISASLSGGLKPYLSTDIQSLMFNRNPSAFVRMPFVSTNAPDTLMLNVRYDDGFVAYLNGTEVARRNAPVSLAFDSSATVDRALTNATVLESINLSASIPLMASGTNVLAVQMLNFAAGNGDALFQPQLVATRLQKTTNVFLSEASPGALNDSDYYYDEVRDTQFSVDRGFFTNAFSLSITSATPDALIYVSFNADEPGPGKGFLYTNAFTITNTTVVRTRAYKEGWKATDVDTATYLFPGDVIYQASNWTSTASPPPQYFPATWGANAVNYGMDPEIVSRHTAAEWHEALTQIPSISIVTEMPNLFDATTGIYANASQQGELWERFSSIELLDPSKAEPGQFQENCGLRIRGGFSRNPQFFRHAFRVHFRREYGAGKLNYPLFENDGAQEFETFDLRNSSNYGWWRESAVGTNDTFVREVWSRETLGAMGQPYRRSRYYHLYINGQYWGISETDERPEASYGETYFGGSKTNFDVVKCGNRATEPDFITEATDGNLVAFSNLWTMCRAHAANPTASNYFRILGRNPDGTRNPALPVMVDVENLIDYMLGIFYTGDGDAPISAFLANNRPNNWFGMRDRTNPDVGFRFFNSDAEHTLGANSSQVDRTGPWRDAAGSNIGNFLYANPQYLHEDLMWNAEYRLVFADRVQKHFFNNGALTFEQSTNRWWKKANQITKAIRAYSARWGDAVRAVPYSESDWTNTLNWVVKTWFPPRAGIVLQQLRLDQLFPSNSAPNLSQLGGAVPAGYNLTLNHTNSGGLIYFTTDGSDPRAIGGAVAGSAQAYSSALVINAPTTVRARVLINGVWSAAVEYIFYPPQDLSKLMISEIMYHPPDVGLTDGDDFEFLELKNTGTNTLNLSGLRFTVGIGFTFPNGATLAPGQFFVMARDPARFASKYPGVTLNGIYSGRLDNAGELVTLSHPLGSEILSITYGERASWPVTADGFNFSLVPKDPNANVDPDDAANWRASSFAGGSPGADDPTNTIAPVLINEVLSHSETTIDFIELFNPTTNTASIGGWFLTDDPLTQKKYRIADGTVLPPLSYVVFDETQFNPTPGTNSSFSLSSHGDEVYLFSGDANTNLTGYSHGFSFIGAADGETFGRYVISTGEEQFPAQSASTRGSANAGPRIGPVVINEIMYNPLLPGYEFIELRNLTGNPIPLFDPALPTNTWRLNGVGVTFPTNITIPPLGLFLIAQTNLLNFTNYYSVPPGVQILASYAGNLQDSGERLELQRPDVPDTNGFAYITVDEVRYNDKAPWPPAADGSGPSLQRKLPSLYGNDPVNWAAAIPTPGVDFLGGDAPSITAQPQSQSTIVGSNVTLSVSVSGSAPFSYVWRLNGTNLPGATSASLGLTNVQASQAGSYSVFVFNGAGSVVSTEATLIVLTPVAFTLQPQSQNVLPGTNVTINSVAVGNGTLRYQWFFEGVAITNATNASYSFINASITNHGNYSVRVTDDISTRLSSNAVIFVLIRPGYVQNLQPQTALQGQTVVFSVVVTGAPPIWYRWILAGTPYLTSSVPMLVLTNVQPADFSIRVAATNMATGLGGLNSSTVRLIVLADNDRDGMADAWEALYGMNSNNAADAPLDSDADGMINRDEYVAGTNPTNSLSLLKLTMTTSNLSLTTTNFGVLEFVAQTNIGYTIQYRTNLNADNWALLLNIAPQASQVRTVQVNAPNQAPDPTRFYRIVTPLVP